MGYINNLTEEQLAKYNAISNWEEYTVHLNEIQEHEPTEDINDQQVHLKNLIVESEVTFWGGETNYNITFTNCYFKKGISFVQGIFFKAFTLHDCYVDGALSSMIGPTTFHDDFNIFSSHIKTFLITTGQFNGCMWQFSGCDKLHVAGGTFGHVRLFVSDNGINELKLVTTQVEGSIDINGGNHKINNLMISNTSKELSLTIDDVKVNKLNFLDFRNDKALKLSKIEPYGTQTEFIVERTFLGKAEFYLIDLRQFQMVSFLDSHLVDCSFINVDWPKKIKSAKGTIYRNPNEKLITATEGLYRLRETYRQLKYALGKQGDFINEQKFHSQELIIYEKLLDTKKDFWTRLIIRLSYWLSDFGQSFNRPFWALLIGHYVLFLLLVLTGRYHGLEINLSDPTEDAFELAFEQYFYLLNPLRRSEGDFKGYLIVIDLLMRIWSSYMIYNIIRATRRFIK